MWRNNFCATYFIYKRRCGCTFFCNIRTKRYVCTAIVCIIRNSNICCANNWCCIYCKYCRIACCRRRTSAINYNGIVACICCGNIIKRNTAACFITYILPIFLPLVSKTVTCSTYAEGCIISFTYCLGRRL